jgi:sec-independent protein translocase protein TatB
MFDIGWSELLVIGSIALIVVGPKDLPGLLRTLGKYAAQARGMAREFQRSMEEAAREADISDIKELREASNELRNLKSMRLDQFGEKKKPAGGPSTAAKPPQTAAQAGAGAPKPSPAPDVAPESTPSPQPAAEPATKADGA